MAEVNNYNSHQSYVELREVPKSQIFDPITQMADESFKLLECGSSLNNKPLSERAKITFCKGVYNLLIGVNYLYLFGLGVERKIKGNTDSVSATRCKVIGNIQELRQRKATIGLSS